MRAQAQAKTALAGCTTNAVIRRRDDTSAVNLAIAAVANDSGAITQNHDACAKLTTQCKPPRPAAALRQPPPLSHGVPTQYVLL